MFEPWKYYYFKYFRAFGVPILSRGFETKQDAIKRSTTEKNKIEAVSWFIISLYTIPRTTIVLFQSDKGKYERFLTLYDGRNTALIFNQRWKYLLTKTFTIKVTKCLLDIESQIITFSSDCNGTRTHNYLARKRKLNHLAKLAKWLSCVVSIYLYGVFDCMFLCHVRVSEWIYTLHLPECQGTPCSKQAWYLQFKWLQRDSNPQLRQI